MPTPSPSSIRKTLEEVHLLQCSLLPGELLQFTDDAVRWRALLDAYALDPDPDTFDLTPFKFTGKEFPPAHFQVRIETSNAAWLDIVLPHDYSDDPSDGGRASAACISVKGDSLRRAEQEEWQRAVTDAMESESSSEFSLYDLISTHLLPRLHIWLEEHITPASASPSTTSHPAPLPSREPEPERNHHALLVSHHLKSPHKRRALRQWARERRLARGFAKLGHPGVIYAEGAPADVAAFVASVRAMQWLALRVRFVEPVPDGPGPGLGGGGGGQDEGEEERGTWKEFEKVGEVVEEMRRLGRENFVVEMGIGSAGTSTSSSSR